MNESTAKKILASIGPHKISTNNPEGVVRGLFSAITLRQETIMELRFGQSNSYLSSIGKEFGITFARVGKLQQQALESMLRLAEKHDEKSLIELGKKNLRRVDIVAKTDFNKNQLSKNVAYRLKVYGGSFPVDVINDLENIVAKYRAELPGTGPQPGTSWNTDNIADAIAARIRKEHIVRL